MIISAIQPNFKGTLKISGPNSASDISLNTDNISSIQKSSYFAKNPDNFLSVGAYEGAIIRMNNNTKVHTYMPASIVEQAYEKAKTENIYELKTPFNPVMQTPLIQ